MANGRLRSGLGHIVGYPPAPQSVSIEARAQHNGSLSRVIREARGRGGVPVDLKSYTKKADFEDFRFPYMFEKLYFDDVRFAIDLKVMFC